MMLECELAVGAFYFTVSGAALDASDFVIIPFSHLIHPSRAILPPLGALLTTTRAVARLFPFSSYPFFISWTTVRFMFGVFHFNIASCILGSKGKLTASGFQTVASRAALKLRVNCSAPLLAPYVFVSWSVLVAHIVHYRRHLQ